MNTINLTEDERNIISKKIATAVNTLKRCEDLECVYLTIYKGENPSIVQGNIFEITAVSSSNRIINYFTEDMRNGHVTTTKFFGDIEFIAILDVTKQTLDGDNRLFNSTILYDRDGRYTKAKEQMQKEYEEGSNHEYIPYGNLLTIEPPIDDKIKEEIGKLDKKRILVMPLDEQIKKEEE